MKWFGTGTAKIFCLVTEVLRGVGESLKQDRPDMITRTCLVTLHSLKVEVWGIFGMELGVGPLGV